MNDELELLARIRNGALDDFEQVIQQHQQQVFKILHRYERDPNLVADLAQETFIKAWHALEQFDGRAPFAHWISRIAVRVALDHLRKRRRVKNEIAFEDLGEEALDWLSNPESDSAPATQDAREILELAMNELSPQERVVITMLEIEERSIREISELMGASGVAVRVRAFRARAKLKKALEKVRRA